jgi:hypothetical protein
MLGVRVGERAVRRSFRTGRIVDPGVIEDSGMR